MDLGNVTVKELLEKKVGKDSAQRVVDNVNDAHKKGKRGEDLQKTYHEAMKNEGHDISKDPGDILYGFIFI